MWTKEQEVAINKQNSNILVSASAGSGKTAVLVERVINKVIKYKIDIDKILVVTFTNASAVELKERLLLAIYKELNKNPNDAFLKRQLTYINRANITTIHAFCLELIRSNFHILDIDPNFSICDEAQSSLLKLKAINNVLEERYKKSEVDKLEQKKLYNLLELFSSKEDTLIEHILGIYNYIMSFSYPFDYLKSSIEKYNINQDIDLCKVDFGYEIYINTKDEIKILLKRIDDILEQIEENEDFIKFYDLLQTEKEMLLRCINSNSFDELYENLQNINFARIPTYKGDNTKLKEKVVSFRTKVLKEKVQELKKSIYAKSKEILNDNRLAYNYLQYIYDILYDFNKEYINLKKKQNLIDFNDIEHLALELLVQKQDDLILKKTDIAQELTNKFVEIYTDEYQDTNVIQEEILNSLSNENNRFMVGDIKQSIYRFRQAMPEIFTKKYNEFKKIDDIKDEYRDVKIILAKNFRSRKQVLESINYIFEKIMSKQVGDLDYSYEEVLTFGADKLCETENNDYKTEINIIDLKNHEDENIIKEQDEINESNDEVSNYLKELKDFEIEAIFIAKKINELVGSFDIYDLKKEEFRKAKYKDIVILLRNLKDKGTILEETLRKYNIMAFCDKSSSVFESDEVKLLLSLLRIIDNPYQDIYMISIMYSIVGNFSLDDIVYIRSINKYLKIYDNLYLFKETIEKKEDKQILNFEKDILEKVDKFINLLETLNKYSKMYDVAGIISKIYDITNIYTQYNLDINSTQKMQNLTHLIDIALDVKTKGILTINEYIKYVDSLKDKSDSSTSAVKVIGENENVVRIMTIHKSKGLEFPIVLLCDTMRKYNMMDLNSSIIMHNKLGVGVNIVDNRYNITYPSLIKQAIKNISQKEIKSEELRMLYVALTRAKEKLIIFATVKDLQKLKDKQFVIYDNNKIDPAIILKNSTYFENIFMAINNEKTEEVNKIFNINITNVNENLDKNILNLSDDIQDSFNVEDEISLIQNRIKSITNNEDNLKDNLVKDILKHNLEYVYKDNGLVNTLSRVSVSKLKHEDNEYLYINNNIKNYEIDDNMLQEKYGVPMCLNENARYTPLRKGTLIHFILEHLDLKKNFTLDELKEYINKLYLNGVIITDDIKSINVKKIYNFLNSKIGKDIKDAKSIFKEQEFILKNTTFSKSIIQGVIDLYYINKNGNIILVDFKTDRLRNEKDYILRYKKQIDIYKEALNRLTLKKVEKSYIYSFELDKEIEVKEGAIEE